ncbi:MAG: DUF1800 domain-containing protein [Chitinophagaceae bacterium]|nr:DUF1800 domain-containing protein [Chitinophagaceae bacterium]
MAVSNQLRNQHLLWRAGFGPMAEDFTEISSASSASYVKALFKASAKVPEYIDVADSALKGLVMGIDEVGNQQKRQLSDEQKKQLREQSRENIKSLNISWLNEMINSNQQLREKMSLFWHGHFASRNLNILYQQQLLDIIRKNALGNFGDLLTGVSKSAAMINFLNNNQNKKDHPNENFAREVMELFTMGRGNYTENDIKEAARAFTGWGATLAGDFAFRPFQHDKGSKTVLGKTGNFTGEDILSLLLSQQQTARFITKKIYRYFVNEDVDEARVDELSKKFFQSNYNISELMASIFSSEWFYDAKNIGNKIKSPIELLAGMQRVLPMEWKNPETVLLLQRLLGQILFYPPNVAGWPGGKTWIDSSSLMLRMRIPQLIYGTDELSMKPKDDDDQMMGRKNNPNKAMGKLGNQLTASEVKWDLFIKQFEKVPREKLLSTLSGRLLQTGTGFPESTLLAHADASSRESFIMTVTTHLMSAPEYQLC